MDCEWACYEKNRIQKSIYNVYHTEKQIVTKIFLSHSGFAFAIAKVNKKVGFGKCFLVFVTVVTVATVSFTERGRTNLVRPLAGWCSYWHNRWWFRCWWCDRWCRWLAGWRILSLSKDWRWCTVHCRRMQRSLSLSKSRQHDWRQTPAWSGSHSPSALQWRCNSEKAEKKWKKRTLGLPLFLWRCQEKVVLLQQRFQI